MSTRQSHPIKSRKLLLIDLENLAGCSPLDATAEMYVSAVRNLLTELSIDDGDLVIVGVNPALAFLSHEIAPTARLVTRTGPNGADLRLVEELKDVRFVRRRFTEVVIASGDVAFLDAVIALNDAGMDTTVVSLRGQLSAALRLAATNVRWLPSPDVAGEAA